MHSYSKEPAEPKVCRYDSPSPRFGVAKEPGGTEVALWVATSSFVQQTVPPTATPVTSGMKRVGTTIFTIASVGAQGPGCALACDPTRTTAAAHNADSVEMAQNAFIAP